MNYQLKGWLSSYPQVFQVWGARRSRQPGEVLKGGRSAVGEFCAWEGTGVGGNEHWLVAELHRASPRPLLLTAEGWGRDHPASHPWLPWCLTHSRAAGVCVETPGGDLPEEAGGPGRGVAKGGGGADCNAGGEVEEGEQPGQGQAAVSCWQLKLNQLNLYQLKLNWLKLNQLRLNDLEEVGVRCFQLKLVMRIHSENIVSLANQYWIKYRWLDTRFSFNTFSESFLTGTQWQFFALQLQSPLSYSHRTNQLCPMLKHL